MSEAALADDGRNEVMDAMNASLTHDLRVPLADAYAVFRGASERLMPHAAVHAVRKNPDSNAAGGTVLRPAVSADSHAANWTPLSGSGVVEVEGASAPPGHGGVGGVGGAEHW